MNKPDTPWSESPEEVASFRAALLDFYDRHGRALPWRESSDPYAILVSEIMAQQTRVETVVSYYERWLERFPTLAALAEAPEDDVLKEWEGLGYYSRARNLHRAAKVVRERHGGRLPESAHELRGLPGVGPYTAGAVASIAFDRAEPAVDGNVRRVYARLFDEAEPRARDVESWAARVVDPGRPGDFNQALMELGATVCSPRGPSCERCPVAACCEALRQDTVEIRPSPRRRSPVRREVRAVAVLVGPNPAGGEHFLLRRRPGEGLLAGMWEFPSCVAEEGDSDARIVERVRETARGLGLKAAQVRETALVREAAQVLSPVAHQFSHLHVTYRAVLFELVSAPASAPPTVADEAECWVGVAGLDRLALPVAQQKIARLALETLP